MPIDAATPEGKAFDRLAKVLFRRQRRLDRLDQYLRGDPPLPEGIAQIGQVAQDFFKTSRTNFAELVAEAPRERMKPTGIRTSADDDEGGDEAAWSVWRAAGLPTIAAEVHQLMFGLGDAYVIVSWDDIRGRAIVTAEDPRQVVTGHDPMTDEIIEALKVFRDEAAETDYAYLYLPGMVLVGEKPASTTAKVAAITGYSLSDWEWNTEKSAPLPDELHDVIPVIRFKNRDGVAEFERHIDVLDRINRTVLRAMVVMTYQAFRQRAIQGDLPEKDDDGKLIDYQELLKAGPDAMWLLPPDSKIWESGQVDLTPIMSVIKNDVLFLAAVTRTPLAMLTPDAATQSAEGASLQREGLVFKTEDRIGRADPNWSQVLSLMFRFAGDVARAAVEKIQLMWAPVERTSVGERASAIAQTKGVLSRYQQLTEIWGMAPDQANRAILELAADTAADTKAAGDLAAATAPPPPPAPVAAPPTAGQAPPAGSTTTAKPTTTTGSP